MSLEPRHETIPVSVSSKAAEFFRSLPKDKQKKLEALLGRTLEDALFLPGTTAKSTREASAGLQTALLSEAALKRIWNSPEEDEAWRDL